MVLKILQFLSAAEICQAAHRLYKKDGCSHHDVIN